MWFYVAHQYMQCRFHPRQDRQWLQHSGRRRLQTILTAHIGVTDPGNEQRSELWYTDCKRQEKKTTKQTSKHRLQMRPIKYMYQKRSFLGRVLHR